MVAMREDIQRDLVAALKRDYGLKQRGQYLRGGRCPSCGRPELFTSARDPWHIKCGRENKCGWGSPTRELYPELFGKLNERFPPTTAEPNATADAYMGFVRGLDTVRFKSWYRQGSFSHPNGNRTTATVVFDIVDPRNPAKKIRMERLVEPVTIREPGKTPEARKAHFAGDYKGLWWAPPGMQIRDGEELWLVEGCIDAVSLAQEGIKAVATLSSYNYPDVMLDALAAGNVRPRLVWAMDGDKAGRKATLKFVRQARKDGFSCAAATIPQEGQKKVDWNDALQANKLLPGDIALYRHHGDLLLAPTALDKGMLIWRRHKTSSFALEFGQRTYWFSMDATIMLGLLQKMKDEGEDVDDPAVREKAEERAATVEEIANCAFRFLYFQQSKLTDESWYYCRVEFPHGRYTIKNTFTGGQVATASEFKKRLLAIAPGALFAGATFQLNHLIKHQLDAIRIVDTVEFQGYSKDHKAWVFNTHAVSGGRVFELNEEDFFEIDLQSVKSLNQSLQLHIGTPATYRRDWLELVYQSFGCRGVIAAAFFLGSFFAEQIRELHKSFPFLEIIGEAGAGKSTLIEALWKLAGRVDYEGFDPNKSTAAARARIMSQVANLPVSFIESDRGGEGAEAVKVRQFDWDELKTAYNGRPSRATGVNNGGNDTKEPPFRGAVMIAQNAPVNASDAILQRIIHLRFDTSGHTLKSKAAADELASLPVENLSYFLLHATTNEARVMKVVRERTTYYEEKLAGQANLKSVRIRKNHAQIMALVEALADLTDLPRDITGRTLDLLQGCAGERQAAIAEDHQIVEEFFDVIDFLGMKNVNHFGDSEHMLAINLNHIVALASQAGQRLPSLLDLKRHLKGARSRQFVEIKAVRSRLSDPSDDKIVKCWIFRLKPGQSRAKEPDDE